MTGKTPSDYEIQSSRAKHPIEFDKIHPNLAEDRGTKSQHTTMFVGLIFCAIMVAGLASMMFDGRVALLFGAVMMVCAIGQLLQSGRQADYQRYATWILESQRPNSEEIKISAYLDAGSNLHHKAVIKGGSGECTYEVDVLTSLPAHTETFAGRYVPARVYRDPSNGLAVVAELEGDPESTRVWLSASAPTESN